MGRHRRTTSRLGPRDNGPGEILFQVEGGHLVRSIGRKDRHSKVCTSKGPRDRRVRLAAHTAIQFYDVQDRLGYDRPSKAVDWLIKKAKASIDELNHRPSTYVNFNQQGVETRETHQQQSLNSVHNELAAADMNMNPGCFIPPSVGSDAMEYIFPTTTSSSATNFHHLLHHHHHRHNQLYQSPIASYHTDEQVFFTETTTTPIFPVLGLDGTAPAWSEHRHCHRHREQQQPPSGGAAEWLPGELGQNSIFSQRGPLQSSIGTPSFHAWMDHSPAITVATGGGDHIHHPETLPPLYPASPNIWISHSSR